MITNLFNTNNTNTTVNENTNVILGGNNMRTSTFENIGTTVNTSDVYTALRDAGLDYTVSKRQTSFMGTDGNQIIIPNVFSTVRDSDEHFYATVSDKYQIIQNQDAFDFVNYVSEDMILKRAGETQSGMIYLIGELPKMTILGDNYQPYLIFRNSHNGRYNLQATICPLRIVCQNQFNIAFKESPNTITIRHSSQAEERMREGKIILQNTANYMKQLNKEAEKYATIHLSDQELWTIIKTLFPIDDSMSDKKKEQINESIMALRNAYHSDDNANFKNTMWGMINAYSDFITHQQPRRQTDTVSENQFIAVTFDPRLMQNLINIMNNIKVA